MSTKIEWAEKTWNPITGCSPVSEGCANCYAKRQAQRFKGRYGYPADDPFKVTFHPDRLDQPSRWRKPRMIFVCSMGDLFHEETKKHLIFLLKVFETIRDCPQHTFIVLTKRPHNIVLFLHHPLACPFSKNVWLGVTAENQKAADERIPVLLQIPAAVRFVSVEPMLGPVKLDHMDVEAAGHKEWCVINALTGQHTDMGRPCPTVPHLAWVICGGETGPGARPMHPDWPRDLRDQCVDAGVPFFFKQWGEWIHDTQVADCVAEIEPDWLLHCHSKPSPIDHDNQYIYNVGKKKAGRLLDGQMWEQMP